MTPDVNAIRVFIDSILSANAGRCLDSIEEREAIAAELVEVLSEYIKPKKHEASQT